MCNIIIFRRKSDTAVKMPFSFWTAGCIYGATSVIAGAFGAHGLKSRGLPEAKIATWSTAAHYQVLKILGIDYLDTVET